MVAAGGIALGQSIQDRVTYSQPGVVIPVSFVQGGSEGPFESIPGAPVVFTIGRDIPLTLCLHPLPQGFGGVLPPDFDAVPAANDQTLPHDEH